MFHLDSTAATFRYRRQLQILSVDDLVLLTDLGLPGFLPEALRDVGRCFSRISPENALRGCLVQRVEQCKAPMLFRAESGSESSCYVSWMSSNSSLDRSTDQTLLDQFGDLVQQHRLSTVSLLRHIDAIDRKLWARPPDVTGPRAPSGSIALARWGQLNGGPTTSPELPSETRWSSRRPSVATGASLNGAELPRSSVELSLTDTFHGPTNAGRSR